MFKRNITVFLILFLLFSCTKTVKINERYKPYKNLLEILSDFRRHLNDDTYRFLPAKDITGKNIYKATLIRLKNYQEIHPGYMEDMISFSMAKAFEKLHDYEQAVFHYEKLLNTKSRLEDEARKNINICADFLRLIEKNRKRKKDLSEKTIEENLKSFDNVLKRWDTLNKRYKNTPYEFLSKEEEEKVDVEKIDFIVKNRYKLTNGVNLAIIGYNQLIEKHKESKKIYSHIIKFGNLYNTLSKEYVAEYNPRGLSFDISEFNKLAHSALDLYGIVASKDGIPEKVEAKGMIESYQAYIEKIRREYK